MSANADLHVIAPVWLLSEWDRFLISTLVHESTAILTSGLHDDSDRINFVADSGPQKLWVPQGGGALGYRCFPDLANGRIG